jgi:membrane protein implicated in regulation of membrane protease activity
MSVILTLVLVGVAVLSVLFSILCVLVYFLYRELRQLRDTQDAIFDSATNCEEFFNAYAEDGFTFSAN